EGGSIERLLNHLQRVLEGMAADGQIRVMDLSMMSESECRQILVGWNQTVVESQRDLSFHELFEEQVEKTPEMVAVVFQDQSLTYRELNARANRLAEVLIEEGVGPEVLVALLAERGVDFLVTVLAIFKAGGAYLPLDSRHPAQRISQVLSRSEAKLVIATSAYGSLAAEAIAGMSADT